MHKPINDPFFEQFFARIPKDVALSFSDAQLDAIKLAFGARTSLSHPVDIRFSIPLFVRRYYLVLLAGRERRPAERLAWERALRPFWNFASTVFFGLLAVLVLGAFVGAAYILKMTLGIDVVPGVDMLPDEQIMRFFK
jgi:hypothetical protein